MEVVRPPCNFKTPYVVQFLSMPIRINTGTIPGTPAVRLIGDCHFLPTDYASFCFSVFFFRRRTPSTCVLPAKLLTQRNPTDAKCAKTSVWCSWQGGGAQLCFFKASTSCGSGRMKGRQLGGVVR
ncbi:hypothetical protein NC651_009816 [Populus alba x Populus x berolinensis]|nr:hypothetical protein NC651_009816 [Populus alba x Populus x berolinensis]